MSGKTSLTLTKPAPYVGLILAMIINGLQENPAHALSGEDVLTKLDTDAQYHYVSGILQGLGYARFLQDRPDEKGLVCIQDWLIDGGVDRWEIAKQWLEHHKEKPTSVIIYAMVRQDCGE